LNEWLTENHGYTSTCDIDWAIIDDFKLTSWVGLEDLTQDEICHHLQQGDGLIANVQRGAHWVLLTGCEGSDNFHVMDPGYDLISYTFDELGQVAVYKAVGAGALHGPGGGAPPPAPKPKPAPKPGPKPKPPLPKPKPKPHPKPAPKPKPKPHPKPPTGGGVPIINTHSSGRCGTNCPGGSCPNCPCGTLAAPVNINSLCAQWTGWSQACCRCIVSHESGGNAHAMNYNSNGSFDVGVFQINAVNWASCNGGKAPCDVASNLECAKAIYNGRRSFAAWSTCSGCGCC